MISDQRVNTNNTETNSQRDQNGRIENDTMISDNKVNTNINETNSQRDQSGMKENDKLINW